MSDPNWPILGHYGKWIFEAIFFTKIGSNMKSGHKLDQIRPQKECFVDFDVFSPTFNFDRPQNYNSM